VMTEYYHQFADHYFRVVAEMRARFEENRKQRDDWQGEDGDEGSFDDRPAEAMSEEEEGERAYEAQRRQPRDNRGDNRSDNRNEGRNEGRSASRNDNRDDGRNEPRPDSRNEARTEPRTDNRERSDYDRPERTARPTPRANARDTGNRDIGNRDGGNRNREPNNRENGYARDDAPVLDALDINVLPPAFGSDGPLSPMPDFGAMDEAPAEVAPKRRGRPRKVVEAE
jgi:hypothetical protein